MLMKVIPVLSLAAIAVACSKSEGGAATTGSFLKPSDFTGLTSDTLTSAQALVLLKDADSVYDTLGQNDSQNTPAEESIQLNNPAQTDEFARAFALLACLSESLPVLNIVEKSTINIDAKVDLLPCVRTKLKDSATALASLNGGKADVRFVFNISCPGADFSSYQGKKLEEIGLGDSSNGLSAEIEGKCNALPAFKTFSNIISETSFGSGSAVYQVSGKAAQFSKTGDACTHTKVAGGFQTNECLALSYSDEKAGTATKKEFSKFESVNLLNSIEPNSLWFAGGKYNVTLNNFTGTLTYTAANTAPTYSLSGGGETITGSLTSPALVQEMVQKPGIQRGVLGGFIAQVQRTVLQSSMQGR